MITGILVLITAIIFFFLGRYSRIPKYKPQPPIEDIIENIKQTVKPKIQPGVIPFRTQEEIADEKSGDKKLDDHWKQSGMEELLK